MSGDDRVGLGALLEQMAGQVDRWRRSVEVPLDLSTADLQSRLDRVFPLSGSRYGLDWRARDPQLSLHDDGFGTLVVDGDVSLFGQTLSGRAHLRGGIHYASDGRAFYLRPLYVTSLSVAGFSSLTLPVKSRLNRMLTDFAENRPIFRLNPESAHQQWIAASLSSVQILEDRLRLLLRPLG